MIDQDIKTRSVCNELLFQIKKLEDKNNVAINVVGYEDKIVEDPFFFIARASSKYNVKEVVHALQIYNEFTSHYVLITDFSKFLHGQTKCKNKKHPCPRCWRG